MTGWSSLIQDWISVGGMNCVSLLTCVFWGLPRIGGICWVKTTRMSLYAGNASWNFLNVALVSPSSLVNASDQTRRSVQTAGAGVAWMTISWVTADVHAPFVTVRTTG